MRYSLNAHIAAGISCALSVCVAFSSASLAFASGPTQFNPSGGASDIGNNIGFTDDSSGITSTGNAAAGTISGVSDITGSLAAATSISCPTSINDLVKNIVGGAKKIIGAVTGAKDTAAKAKTTVTALQNGDYLGAITGATGGDSNTVPVTEASAKDIKAASQATQKASEGTQSATQKVATKQCITNQIAIRLARVMARNISNSIVNWINKDFNGKPSFVTDFKGLAADTADTVIGNFIYGSDLKNLCEPFSFKVRLALATKYQQPPDEEVRCRVTDIAKNASNFVKSNGGVGWNHWLEITTQPQNNEYGAYLIADSQLAQKIQQEMDIKNQELAWGNGFMGVHVCDAQAKDRETDAQVKERVAKAKLAQQAAGAKFTDTASLDTTPRCLSGGRIVTPGAYVVALGGKAVTSANDDLHLAEDINQVIGALISHFGEKLMSKASGGFLGLSSPGGYAQTPISYSTASALASDFSNPENSGLSEAFSAVVSDLNLSVDTGDNLALGKAVTESAAGIGSSAWATDGDADTSASTAEVSNPWIEVDLGQSTSIAEVHVWSPAGKSASASVGTFDVVVSEERGGRDWVSDQVALTDSSPNPSVVPVNKAGRYIRIQRFNNSYQCDSGSDAGGAQNCFYPLSVAEIEAVGTNSSSQSSTGSATESASLPISVGPASGPATAAKNSPISITIPLNSSTSGTISTVETRLYAGSEPISFNSVFSNGAVGLKQNGFTRNYSPETAAGIDFANVAIGPTSGTAVTVTGNLLSAQPSNTYKIVVTARDSSKAAVGTASFNFVVQ